MGTTSSLQRESEYLSRLRTLRCIGFACAAHTQLLPVEDVQRQIKGPWLLWETGREETVITLKMGRVDIPPLKR